MSHKKYHDLTSGWSTSVFELNQKYSFGIIYVVVVVVAAAATVANK